MSYRASSVTRGFNFINSDNGCPMPPAAPKMVTLDAYGALVVSISSQDPICWPTDECFLLGPLTCLTEAEKDRRCTAPNSCLESILYGVGLAMVLQK
jgi:hypothetical protein